MICPRRYALRVSHNVACEISGEELVSRKNCIWAEMNFTKSSSKSKRGLSLQILFWGGRFGRSKSNRKAL